MNDQTDSQLLRDYAENRSEAAFTELVRRHVDLVYSAARRMVYDPHLAEDVTQGVFVAFAKNARQLADRSVVSGWLHRTAQNIASQTVRTIERRRAREQEAAVMNELLSSSSDETWEHIAPHLDAALGELSEPDRDALLLRYFERKSAHEMAQTLGVSEEAAQKRVNRAVERLREFFSKRNVTVGASGLVVLISTFAVQAAPVGLIVTISTSVSLAGIAIQTSTAVTVTKTIAMSTMQKGLMTMAIVVTTAAGIYEARRASNLQKEIQSLRKEKSPLIDRIQKLKREREDFVKQLATLREDNERFKPRTNTTELLTLRGEVGVLRRQLDEFKYKESAARVKRPSIFEIPDLSQHDLPRNFPTVAWVYSGHSNPESTLATLMWAFREGNMSVIMNTLAPESVGNWQKLLGAKSMDEIADKSFNFMKNVSWFDFIGKKTISDKNVQLTISIGDELIKVSVKNVHGEWRVGDLE